MEYRRARIDEINILVALRKKQRIDEGLDPSQNIDRELFGFFKRKLGDDSLIQWVAIDNQQVIATAGIIFYDFPPTYTNSEHIRGYITNVYTKDSYRKQGIASHLLEIVINEARNKGIKKVWLGASTLGKPVYKKLGFIENDTYLELQLQTIE